MSAGDLALFDADDEEEEERHPGSLPRASRSKVSPCLFNPTKVVSHRLLVQTTYIDHT